MTDEKKEPTEYTPGPWARSKDDWWVYSKANGEMIVDDIATENEFDYWLIAAAPDLLNVCEMIINAVDGGDEMAVVDAARAAVAKARHISLAKGQ